MRFATPRRGAASRCVAGDRAETSSFTSLTRASGFQQTSSRRSSSRLFKWIAPTMANERGLGLGWRSVAISPEGWAESSAGRVSSGKDRYLPSGCEERCRRRTRLGSKRRCLSLPRSIPPVHLPAFHHEDDSPQRRDVLRGISVHRNDVCLKAWSERADDRLHA